MAIRRKVKASTVVEMSYMMGVVMLMWMVVLFTLFYYYDKLILSGAAYETVVVGSEMMHEEEQVDATQLETFFRERIRGKLIFMPSASAEAKIDKNKIVLEVRARNKGLNIFVVRKMAVTTPEEKIRAIRTTKEVIEELQE